MRKLIDRILRGFRENLGRGLIYAFLIYMAIAVLLKLAAPYLPSSEGREMTPTEHRLGIALAFGIGFVALSLSGWFVSDES